MAQVVSFALSSDDKVVACGAQTVLTLMRVAGGDIVWQKDMIGLVRARLRRITQL